MLSQDIQKIINKHESLSLKKVMNQTHESVFGFLLALLALPSALPIPAPGYSIPFGVVIILLALQIIMGRKSPWFPEKIENKEVSIIKLKGGIKKIKTFITFFEKLIKPRLSWVYSRGQNLFGFIILLCGISMLIPIPGTNTVPALGVFIMGLGMIEEDGLIGLGGVLTSLVGIAITILILFLGAEGIQLLWEQVFS